MGFAALKCAAVSIKCAFRFLGRYTSLLSVLFSILSVRRVRLLLLSAAALLLSAGVARAQTFADYKVATAPAEEPTNRVAAMARAKAERCTSVPLRQR